MNPNATEKIRTLFVTVQFSPTRDSRRGRGHDIGRGHREAQELFSSALVVLQYLPHGLQSHPRAVRTELSLVELECVHRIDRILEFVALSFELVPERGAAVLSTTL
jgi:hypothetical protein